MALIENIVDKRFVKDLVLYVVKAKHIKEGRKENTQGSIRHFKGDVSSNNSGARREKCVPFL